MAAVLGFELAKADATGALEERISTTKCTEKNRLNGVGRDFNCFGRSDRLSRDNIVDRDGSNSRCDRFRRISRRDRVRLVNSSVDDSTNRRGNQPGSSHGLDDGLGGGWPNRGNGSRWDAKAQAGRGVGGGIGAS